MLSRLVLCSYNFANYNLVQEAYLSAYLGFIMPSSLNWITSTFWFKVKGVWLFLSLEHLTAIVGLLIGWIWIFLCLNSIFIACNCPQTIIIVASKITDHYNNYQLYIMGRFEILLNVTQKHEVNKCCYKNGADGFAWYKVKVTQSNSLWPHGL